VDELLTQTMAANEALLRANADLEQFAYAASHDLQEPLRMIAIYSQLLQRRHYDTLGSDGKELLDTLIEGAHRMNQLVADLLSYTRVDNSDGNKSEVTNPEEVLHEVEQALMERIISLDARISFDPLAPLMIHRTHLVQLLQNLVSNSLKYHTPERKPRIHISSVPAGDGMTELRVQDNGIGINPEYHERIFGVFKRLHTSAIPGTGIGLAICKKIVRHYGGSIWVESQGRGGSTFHLTLPTATEESGYQRQISEDVDGELQERHRDSGMTRQQGGFSHDPSSESSQTSFDMESSSALTINSALCDSRPFPS
jgi:light-regulated signal transduction histidine kinase (bacteriophytochrome)